MVHDNNTRRREAETAVSVHDDFTLLTFQIPSSRETNGVADWTQEQEQHYPSQVANTSQEAWNDKFWARDPASISSS